VQRSCPYQLETLVRHDDQLCASLPMTQVSFTAWYCHVHMAWCVRTSVSLQDGQDEVHVRHSTDVALGPFDDAESLLALATELVARGAQEVSAAG
jgi:hypothetical protein